MVPLVNEARDWVQGTFLDKSFHRKKRRLAADGKIGRLRRDPMAMPTTLMDTTWPTTGLHWINIGKKDKGFLPKFSVNWFRKDEGATLYGQGLRNSRVLKWIFDRIEKENSAIETPIGNLPSPNSIDIES